MIWVAAILVFWALCAAFPITADRLPFLLIGSFWGASLFAQTFALPLLIVTGVLALFAESAALVLLLASAGLLAFAHGRNRRAGRIMLATVGLRDTAIPLHAGLTPFVTGASKVRRIRDIAYGEAGKDNLLDLIVPRTLPTAPMPVLVHVHGGGWIVGHKRQQALPLLHYLAARGWLCVDINYRLGPANRFPTIFSDVLRALAWVKTHAHEHGGDPSRVAITGGSAGGHLVALAALAHDDPGFKPGFESEDCSVAAAVPLYGMYDFEDRANWFGKNHHAMIDTFMGGKVMPGTPPSCPELWRSLSPIERVRADAPPMLVAHGTGDSLAPYQGVGDFAAALRARSGETVTRIELPGIQHGWDMAMSALAWAHVRAVTAFLAPLERAEPNASRLGEHAPVDAAADREPTLAS